MIFFIYLNDRGVNPNGRSLLFHLLTGLRDEGLVPQNPDEKKFQELYEVLSQIRSKFENYMVPDEDLYHTLDKIILYFNKLFVSDFHNELTQRMSWLGFDNTQSLGAVHPIQEILRKRIEYLTRIGQLKIVKGRAKQESSPVQLLINRLLDLKADANGNYTIPEDLKIAIQQLYNNNTQLVTDLVEQGISQGLTNELIAQATQHLELVDNQPQTEPLERKNATSKDNE